MAEIIRIKVWNNQSRTEYRIYVEASDGREGCRYLTGNSWHKKGSQEGDLTAAEWAEANRIGKDAQNVWHTWYAPAASAVAPATPAAPASPELPVFMFDEMNEPGIGQTIKRNGQYLTVVKTRRQRRTDEDDDMYGATGADWTIWATCRPATENEIAALKAQHEAAAQRKAAEAEVTALVQQIRNTGTRPDGAHDLSTGKRLLDRQSIYGSGDWFVVMPTTVWYVQNNGMDGDDWSRNNVRTGGAGAIGWFVPLDERLVERLESAEAVLMAKA